MMPGERFVRHHLQPFITQAPKPTSSAALLRLDANERCSPPPLESPLAGVPVHRYPDPAYAPLRQAYAAVLGVAADTLVAGNGSDELIDLLIRACCEPGADRIVVFEPTFEMYAHWAHVSGVEVVRIPLGADFALDAATITAAVDAKPKLVFVCSPNNPTGNLLDIDALLAALGGAALVVVDEAYLEFSSASSWITRVQARDDLVVLRTLSKAWGLAALRVGAACAPEAVRRALDRARAPFNVSALSARFAEHALALAMPPVSAIAEERERLQRLLPSSPHVGRTFPSVANFVLCECPDVGVAAAALLEAGVSVRTFPDKPRMQHMLRVTVGTSRDNDVVLRALGVALPAAPGSQRNARTERRTKETRVVAVVSLDGAGKSRISTGVRFFDHMLEQLAKHSGTDIEVEATSDLDVDVHHAVEDVALALGTSFARALGDGRGTERYGFVLPMDDALVTVAIDLGGRPYCACELPLTADRVGDLPTALVPHVFRSFATALGATLHVRGTGSDDHHLVEAAFKGLGRSLKQALRKDPSAPQAVPSTKGAVDLS